MKFKIAFALGLDDDCAGIFQLLSYFQLFRETCYNNKYCCARIFSFVPVSPLFPHLHALRLR